MVVNCPTCGKDVTWDENSPFRPFCSKRCQLIDLGEWASGDRAIPAEEESPSEPDDYE
ncbi:DNA gyrase inhibitor YacG [Gallaecimonas mangrovi]|uniref:DNA gyrase inhibitor YacG n=1 Tax=Gallaecimonas mangrovi TaxID=2291597 RepID=UPI000E207B19|nr:DNA gyrase inhibitor YacG [Gallaecimonas mangrovi]